MLLASGVVACVAVSAVVGPTHPPLRFHQDHSEKETAMSATKTIVALSSLAVVVLFASSEVASGQG